LKNWEARRVSVLAAAVLLCASPVLSHARGSDDPWLSDVNIRLLGLDVGMGWRGLSVSPNVDTILWAYLGGGYEWQEYYREPSGALMAPGTLAGRDPVYPRIEALGKLGIAQGIAWNERTNRNLLEAFIFYITRYDAYQAPAGGTLAASSLSDRDGSFQNSFLGGLTLDNVRDDPDHKIRSGFVIEASTEWGPSWFFNTLVGNADFVRLNANARIFLPLFDVAPDRPVNLVSAYLADFMAVDYAIGIGAAVPLSIRQTFGGRHQQTGLGYAVRGVSWGSCDTNLKAVNNLELRVNLPALVIPDLVPGLLAFLDAGWYDQVGEAGTADPPPSGVLASTGFGAFLDFLDLVTAAVYLDYRIDAENLNGQRWSVAAEATLHF
jgi:hypothetical protein